MQVGVVHSISDSQGFFAATKGDVPAGMSVKALVPSKDGSKAFCLWEAESVDAVRDLVEKTVGDLSSNEYFEVDSGSAQGLSA